MYMYGQVYNGVLICIPVGSRHERTFGYFLVLPCTVMYPLTGNREIAVLEIRICTASTYCYILTGECVYLYIQVYTVTYKYIPVHTS
jgi:hypothetical protein